MASSVRRGCVTAVTLLDVCVTDALRREQGSSPHKWRSLTRGEVLEALAGAGPLDASPTPENKDAPQSRGVLRPYLSGCGLGLIYRVAHGQGIAASISSASAVNWVAWASVMCWPLQFAACALKVISVLHADPMLGTAR